jgi:hypothetical protein
MNWGTILEEVRDHLGEYQENFHKDAALLRAANEAVRRFNRSERWPWLVTERTGDIISQTQPELELIDDVDLNRHLGIELVKTGDATGRIILPERVTPIEGMRRRQRYNRAAEPNAYYLVRGVRNTYEDDIAAPALVVRFLPSPDGEYMARYMYFRSSQPIVELADEPDLPADYHDAVVHYVCGRAWLKELNGSRKAQEQFDLFNSVLDQAKGEHLTLADDERLGWGSAGPEHTARSWYEWHLPQQLG